MAYMVATAPCWNCGRVFSFNPSLVPSLRVNGQREAICRPCIERANPIRIERGLEPIPILPGAYEPEEVL